MSRRPLVKICGLTRPADAVLCADLGADLLGLNFVAGSPRRVTVEEARAIARELGGRVPLVGVFVNAGRVEIEDALAGAGLDLAQLHGDEADELVRALGGRALKAFRGGPPPAPRLGDFPEAYGFLVDGGDRLRYGGTGEAWAWSPLPRPAGGRPVLVAGGIRPGNALAALMATGADGIDVASGVESAPGEKDPALVRRLFEEIEHGASAHRT